MLGTLTFVSKRALYASPANTYIWKFYYHLYVANLDIYRSAKKSKEEIKLLKTVKLEHYLAKLNQTELAKYFPSCVVKKYCQIKSLPLLVIKLQFVDTETLIQDQCLQHFEIPINVRIYLISAIQIIEYCSVLSQIVVAKLSKYFSR